MEKKQKHYLFQKGHMPWNKGKKKVYKLEALENMRKNHLANFDTEDAINLYQSGKSCSEVAKILNCSYSAVWRRLTPLNILRDKGYSNRGKKLSEETKKKMSAFQKARFEDPIEHQKISGKNNPFYGKKHKPETIERMKEKLSIMFSGPNAPNWLGGLSYEPYGKEFNNKLKNEIRKRDEFECQECGILQINLTCRLLVHHIDYDKRNNKPSNLISLCRPCHMKTNYKRGDWTKHFQSKEVMMSYDN